MVSEFMLQQTGVDRVRDAYSRFLARFPDVKRLAAASPRDVLEVWSGLGYNRRAVALLKAAHVIVTEYRGRIPRDPQKLRALPGVGQSTAGAIMAFAHGTGIPFVETNIRRVFIHFFFPGASRVTDREIIPLIEETLYPSDPRTWYYALMDYGAMLGETSRNENRRSAHYHRQKKFEGSSRQMRGRILRALLTMRHATAKELAGVIHARTGAVQPLLEALAKEGFLVKSRKGFSLR